jgi:hypothetical protein
MWNINKKQKQLLKISLGLVGLATMVGVLAAVWFGLWQTPEQNSLAAANTAVNLRVYAQSPSGLEPSESFNQGGVILAGLQLQQTPSNYIRLRVSVVKLGGQQVQSSQILLTGAEERFVEIKRNLEPGQYTIQVLENDQEVAKSQIEVS